MKLRRLPASAGMAVGLLAVALFFFAPHLWLMRHDTPGSFEWARADDFLKQCANPFRRDIVPALRWRALPALVCHVIGLQGRAALALPVCGVVLMMMLAVHEFVRRLGDRRLAALALVPLATSSAALVPLQFFGVNDAWAWLGLIATAFSPGSWALPLACLLGPWVDERFVLGFPLALIVRCLDRNEPLRWRAALPALWLAPYLAVRIAFIGDSSTHFFLTGAVRDSVHYLALAPLGWWMALRAGWFAVAAAFFLMPRPWRLPAAAMLAAGLCASALFASDLSRSAALAVPLMMWGLLAAGRRWPAQRFKLLGALAAACLLIPAANVVYTKIDPVNPLLIELIRLWRPQ